MGSFVIYDEEARFKNKKDGTENTIRVVAIYELVDNLIQKIWFIDYFALHLLSAFIVSSFQLIFKGITKVLIDFIEEIGIRNHQNQQIYDS